MNDSDLFLSKWQTALLHHISQAEIPLLVQLNSTNYIPQTFQLREEDLEEGGNQTFLEIFFLCVQEKKKTN